mgnify:CR=1 FL=1
MCEKSDDLFLLMQGTTTLKNFVHLASKQAIAATSEEQILVTTKRLLEPTVTEQAASSLGNLVIQVIDKV